MGAPRCSDCNRLVSIEPGEAEINDVSINGDELEASMRLVLNCAECGQEVREAEAVGNTTIDHQCTKTEDGEDKEDDEEPEFEEVDQEVGDIEERYADKDRKGKPIKNPRYQKKFYGATATITVQCSKCEEEFPIEVLCEEQASAFEDIG